MANSYRLSNGQRVSKTVINKKVKEAKQTKLTNMQNEFGYIFCEECHTSTGFLDNSHDISVDDCQKSGRSELAWSVDNITIRCRECHKKHDKL